MKLPLVALSLFAFVTPAFASASFEASGYFAANSAVSFGALVLAASSMMAANALSRRRHGKLAEAMASASWRRSVMQNLEADLQSYSRQLRRAA